MALQDDLNRLQKQLGNFSFPGNVLSAGPSPAVACCAAAAKGLCPIPGRTPCVRGPSGAAPRRCTIPAPSGRLSFALNFRAAPAGWTASGRLMADCAARWYPGEFDAVTWVPVSRKRLRQRGFDQSRLLAASLCVDWHVAPVETLRKAVDNPAQSGLTDAEHRRANVLGVYEALPENVGTSVSCSSTISSPPAPPSPSVSGCCGQ